MARRLRLLALAGALAAAVIGHAQAPEEADLPVPENYFPALKSLLESAAHQSPRMIASDAAEAMAEADRVIARSGQLPSLGGYLNYLPWDRDFRRDDPNSPYTSQKSTYALNLVQPIYHWGALESRTRIAELEQRVAAGETAEAYRALAGEIRGQFLQLVVKKAGWARARFNLTLVEKQAALAQARFDRHEIAESDLFPKQLAVEQAQLAVDRTADDYGFSRHMLARLAGVGAITDAQVPDAIPPVAVPLDRLRALLDRFAAQDQPASPALQSLKDQIEIEKLNTRIENAQLRPKLNFILGSSEDEQSYTANIGQRYGVTSFYTGLQVNWSIFDGYATKGSKLKTLAHRRELERSYRQASSGLLDQAHEQLRQVQFAARSLDIAEKLLRTSEDNLQTTAGNVARGFAAESDLQAARLGRDDARIAAFSARAEVFTRSADFLATLLKDPVLSNLPAPRP